LSDLVRRTGQQTGEGRGEVRRGRGCSDILVRSKEVSSSSNIMPYREWIGYQL